MARSRRLGLTSLTTAPSISTSPSVCASSPAMIRRVVDFPHPEGPTRVRNSPSAMWRSMPSRTFVSPKVLVMPWSLMLAKDHPSPGSTGEPPCARDGRPTLRAGARALRPAARRVIRLPFEPATRKAVRVRPECASRPASRRPPPSDSLFTAASGYGRKTLQTIAVLSNSKRKFRITSEYLMTIS